MSQEVHLIYEDRPFFEMLIAHAKHDAATKPGTELVCIRCKKAYHRGEYDFHQLCNTCFEIFDSQKMRGRGAYLKGDPIPYNEDVDQWIKKERESK